MPHFKILNNSCSIIGHQTSLGKHIASCLSEGSCATWGHTHRAPALCTCPGVLPSGEHCLERPPVMVAVPGKKGSPLRQRSSLLVPPAARAEIGTGFLGKQIENRECRFIFETSDRCLYQFLMRNRWHTQNGYWRKI